MPTIAECPPTAYTRGTNLNGYDHARAPTNEAASARAHACALQLKQVHDGNKLVPIL
jgi:hypothetical protein